jgi:thioesterase domain-containing protein
VSVAAFLADLRRRDIRVWADGDRLHCDAPSGALTPELRDQLRSRKPELLEFLRAAQSLARQERAIVPLQPRGTRTPVFAVPGHNGDVFCYRALAQYLGEQRPFFGLEPPGLDGFGEPLVRIEELAAYFAAQIHAFRPAQPCILAGYCAGGTVAVELARQLRQRGATIRYVALFGSPFPTWYRWPAQLLWHLGEQSRRVAMHARALATRSFADCRNYLREKLAGRQARIAAEALPLDDPVMLRRRRVEEATLKALRAYAPTPFDGHVGVFLPFQDAVLNDAARRWRMLAARADEYFGPPGSDGFNLLREPHVFATSELFRRSLDAVEGVA